MTKEEMEKRIKELGGLNPKTALIVSIEKWKWMTWENCKNASRGMNTCALCQEHYVQHDNNCTTCPLYDGNGGCDDGSSYNRMCDAVGDEDKMEYMEARRNIIRRMQRALKRLDWFCPKCHHTKCLKQLGFGVCAWLVCQKCKYADPIMD